MVTRMSLFLCFVVSLACPANTQDECARFLDYRDNSITWRWTHSDGRAMSMRVVTPSLWDFVAESLERKQLKDSNSSFARAVMRDRHAPFVRQAALELRALAHRHGLNEVDVVLTFVQSMRYVKERGNHVAYPSQTLLHVCGDCSDSSILLVGLLRQLGYRTVFLSFPHHLAVGVAVSGAGKYWKYRGRSFLACETTARGWAVGQFPSEYEQARILPVN